MANAIRRLFLNEKKDSGQIKYEDTIINCLKLTVLVSSGVVSFFLVIASLNDY